LEVCHAHINLPIQPSNISNTPHLTFQPPSPTTFHSQTLPPHPPNPIPPLPNLTHLGNSTYAGATAAIVANIVLLSYVVVAFNDDKSEREADLASGAIQPSEGRKDR
jgi:hypothetical protein